MNQLARKFIAQDVNFSCENISAFRYTYNVPKKKVQVTGECYEITSERTQQPIAIKS